MEPVNRSSNIESSTIESSTVEALQLKLYCQSSEAWLCCVLNNFDEFLVDHAANERKASSMAMSLVAHYPDRAELTLAMVDLALDELNHFRQVFRLMQERNLVMTPDEKDPYVNQLRSHLRKESEAYFMDRLLVAAVIEARGEERFTLISERLTDDRLSTFYRTLSNSERGHHELAERRRSSGSPETRSRSVVSDIRVARGQGRTCLRFRSRRHGLTLFAPQR